MRFTKKKRLLNGRQDYSKNQERIIYEVYQEEETLKRPSGLLQESRKKRKLEG
jgi:hypothetical protein